MKVRSDRGPRTGVGRLALRAGAAAVLGLAALPLLATPAGAVDVSDEAGLRLAFADTAATTVVLQGDVELADCEAGELARPAGAEALLLEGGGHTITQTCSGARVIRNDGGALGLVSVTITGGSLDAGAGVGQGGGVYSAGELTLEGATITGNRADGDLGGLGGGVAGAGAVTVRNSTLRSNTAGGGTSVFGGRGGAIAAAGLVAVETSTVADNVSEGGESGGGQAGGVFAEGSAAITGTTISGNVAAAGSTAGSGSMAAVTADGDLVVLNTTVTANVAEGDGAVNGGITAAGSLEIVYSTIVANVAATRAANVAFTSSGSVFGSVIGQPGGGAPNCSNALASSAGYNAADDGSCGLEGSGDRQDVGDFGLGGLDQYGGSTQTLAPQEGSVLLDAIPSGSCQSGPADGVGTDQRGEARPSGDGCDIGAVEGVGTATPPTTTTTEATATTTTAPSETTTTEDSAPATTEARPGGDSGSSGGGAGNAGTTSQGRSGSLVRTGMTIGGLVLLGLGLIAVGWYVLRVRRAASEGAG